MRAGLTSSKRAQSDDRDEPVHGARSLDCRGLRAPVAHRTERSAPDRKAAGSIPARRTFIHPCCADAMLDSRVSRGRRAPASVARLERIIDVMSAIELRARETA